MLSLRTYQLLSGASKMETRVKGVNPFLGAMRFYVMNVMWGQKWVWWSSKHVTSARFLREKNYRGVSLFLIYYHTINNLQRLSLHEEILTVEATCFPSCLPPLWLYARHPHHPHYLSPYLRKVTWCHHPCGSEFNMNIISFFSSNYVVFQPKGDIKNSYHNKLLSSISSL